MGQKNKTIRNSGDDEDSNEESDDEETAQVKMSKVKKNKSVAKPSEQVDSTVIKGKFSIQESNLILQKVTKFMQDNSLELSDIILGLRDPKNPGRKVHAIWQELSLEIPNRSIKAIYQHANRKLMLMQQTPWTDADKNMLKQQVEEKGRNWSLIGRLMGKLSDDCKHVFTRMQERKNTGRFTAQEDDEIIAAIRTHFSIDSDISVENFPDKKIPWTAIARTLGSKRHGLDYLRRWPTIKSIYAHSLNNNRESQKNKADDGTDEKKNPDDQMPTYNRNKRARVAQSVNRSVSDTQSDQFTVKMLSHLDAKKDELVDATLVSWADVDRELNFPYGFAAHKWTMLLDTHSDELLTCEDFRSKVNLLLTRYSSDAVTKEDGRNQHANYHKSAENSSRVAATAAAAAPSNSSGLTACDGHILSELPPPPLTRMQPQVGVTVTTNPVALQQQIKEHQHQQLQQQEIHLQFLRQQQSRTASSNDPNLVVNLQYAQQQRQQVSGGGPQFRQPPNLYQAQNPPRPTMSMQDLLQPGTALLNRQR